MILFKTKEQRKAIRKLQSGGSVPYYAPYDVQVRPESTAADIGVMMTKHAKPVASPKREAKKKVNPYENIKGLPNDKKAYYAKADKLEREYEFLMNTYPNSYAQDPKFQEVSRQLNRLYSYELDNLSQQKDLYDDAKKNIKDGGYSDQWMMQGNVGVVRDAKTDQIRYIPAEDVNATDKKGNKLYKKVLYKDGLNLRRNSLDTVLNLDGTKGNLIVADDFTNFMNSGMSEAEAYKKIIDPMLKTSAYDKETDKLTIKNSTVDGAAFKEYVEGSSWKSNQVQKNAKFKALLPALENSPAKSALMAAAYSQGAETVAEAEALVHQNLSNYLAGEIGMETTGVDVLDVPEVYDPANPAGGGSTGPHKKLGEIWDVENSSTEGRTITIDQDAEPNAQVVLGGKIRLAKEVDRTTQLIGNLDTYTMDVIDPEGTLAEQKKKTFKYLHWDKAFFMDKNNTRISSVTSNLDEGLTDIGGEDKNLIKSSIVNPDEEVIRTNIFMKDGKMANLTNNPKYRDMLVRLESYDKQIKQVQKGSPKEAEIREERKAYENATLNDIGRGYDYRLGNEIIHVNGVEVIPVSLVNIVINTEKLELKKENEEVLEGLKSTFKKSTDPDLKDLFNLAMVKEKKSDGSKDRDFIVDWEGDYSTAWIAVPRTGAHSQITRSDKDNPEIYVPLHDVTAVNVYNTPAMDGKGRTPTINELKNIGR